MTRITRNEHDALLARCRKLREQNPMAFAMVKACRETGRGYPQSGSPELKVVQEHDRLSARAARFTTGF